MSVLIESPDRHFLDIIQTFYEVDYKKDTLSEDFINNVKNYLKTFVDKGIIIENSGRYSLHPSYLPKKKEVIESPVPTELEVINTLKQINKYINFIELSMVYFNSCDTTKLKVILDSLVAQNVLKIDKLDTNKHNPQLPQKIMILIARLNQI